MTRINLFEKRDDFETMLALQNELVQSKLFKLPTNKYALTVNSDVNKSDYMIAESNVSDFITIWTRHERKGGKKRQAESASYGIRVKTALADIPSMKALLGNMNTSFNDSNEYRIACYSADDVKFFVTTILQYLQQHSVNRKTKEIVNTESVIA